MSRHEVAAAGFRHEYEPVVEMLREAGLLGRGTETEVHVRVVALRYLRLRTHEWDNEVVERLRRELDRPSTDADTMARRLRRELTR